jgi:hypothetical protein
MSTRRIYTISVTEDNQFFAYSVLASLEYSLAPTVAILSVIGDAIVNLHPDNPPTNEGFTIIVGSAGQVPSVSEPIPVTIEIISNDISCEEDDTELLTPEYVKCNLPNWELYCGISTEFSADELLQKAIDLAESEFLNFITVTSDDMTDPLRRHLFNIAAYNCFMYKHGDTEFKEKPQIIMRYLNTKKLLEGGLISTGNISITAKDRLFDEGFTKNDELWYEVN